jgi:hypothetical protein
MSRFSLPIPQAKPPFVTLMRKLGLNPDPWQKEVLEGGHKQLLLNCCRQAGKSTVVAVLSIVEAVWVPETLVLLLSRSHRQSTELFRKVLDFHHDLGSLILARKTVDELELLNRSRIVCLPCAEETIRGYSNVSLLIVDEAARVPFDLFRAVGPMLAVSNGRMICLSTPYGKQGFFYDAWTRGGADWHRIEVPAQQITRLKPDFLASQRRLMGESWFRQEFGCSFEALEGLVYPDFARCVVPGPAPEGRRVGGIDFGFRNPFAAIWGVCDRDDVLWITGEHFSREQSLAFHVQNMPRKVEWSADPSGSTEIHEFKRAGLLIRRADNEIRPGIAAVRARLESGMLKVIEGACPNLLAEAGLYRYDPDSVTEQPIKEYDHTMDALRYLITRLDAARMARIRHSAPATQPPSPGSPPASPPQSPPAPQRKKWLRYSNEALWTRLSGGPGCD